MNDSRDQFIPLPRKFKFFNLLLILLYIVTLLIVFIFKKESNSSQSHLDFLLTNQRDSRLRLLNNTYDLSYLNNTFNNEHRKHSILVESFLYIIAYKEYEGFWNINNDLTLPNISNFCFNKNFNISNQLINKNNRSLDSLNQPNCNFRNREGTFKIKISTAKDVNLYIGTSDTRTVIFEIEIRDGKYKDRYLILKHEITYYFDLNRDFMNTVNITFDINNFKRIEVSNKNGKKIPSIETVYDLFQLNDNKSNLDLIFSNLLG
jgi:hypothetical protein